MSRIVIKNVRLSYANIWEPKPMKDDPFPSPFGVCVLK